VLVRIEGLDPALLPEGTPRGTRWMRFDQERLLAARGLNTGALRELQNSDPARQLATLGSLADETRREGEEDVRGVRTTRYRLVISGDRLVERLTEGAEDPPEPSKEVREARFPFEIWVDAAGRVRRARLDWEIEGTSVNVTSEVVALERGLRVKVPSGAEVFDATEDALRGEPDG
jgi:hypothetical protein